jgi:hypothetical protein
MKWYSLQKSFISIQSYDTSMMESLVMLIIDREYYPQYPLFPWEHGTEALEHTFGISRRDFNFYEFFKIQQRVYIGIKFHEQE